MNIDEIGLEKEVWLLDQNNKIVEPAIFSFPNDDFGFLIELRTRPHKAIFPILEDLDSLTKAFKYQAELFNLKIIEADNMPIDKKLIEELRIKYNYFNLKDLTENIFSGGTRTHATGIIKDNLSAGLHIHFSRKTKTGQRVQLPIFHIVNKMNNEFLEEINKAKRILGEYEIKPYGFEFRSLPSTVNAKKVLEFAFTLFP